MQRFLGSFISIRRNRFKETGSKIESVLINYVKLRKSLNSINSEEEYFILIVVLDYYLNINYK